MSDRKQFPSSQANQGVQANTVTADVMAVGQGAQAYKQVTANREELSHAIEQLQSALQHLELLPQARAALAEDVAVLRSVADSQKPQPEHAVSALQNLAGKLKMVGVVLSDAVALGEPMRKIAQLLGVSIHFLGL